MVIAVNAIFLQNNLLEGYGHYANEILKRIVQSNPEHQFIFIFDRPFNKQFIFGENVTAIKVAPAARHVPAFIYWYNISAALAIKKYKPSIWIQPYGFCSLTTAIPQLLVVHDLAFKQSKKEISWHQQWFYQYFIPKFLKKATNIITVSNYSKHAIEEAYPFTKNRIKVIPGAAREEFKPINWDEKQQIKEAYTDGFEYFICVGGISPRKNLMNVLKAYSLFKKWHKSNMKLVFAGRLAWNYHEILEKLKTYKYKDDVVLTGYLSDELLQKLTAGAYAAMYMSTYEGFGLPILEAMQAGVPVIAGNNSSMPEVGGDAALYADSLDPIKIAEQMQLLYKDEKLREIIIKKGLQRVITYNWDHTAALFWQEIIATVNVS
jgi:glycosyltransferase involved in cell wall biosynthesis